MTDDRFVCHECGRTFRGINARIGEEMCPQCGSIDIERVAPAAPAAPARPDAPTDAPAHPSDPTVAPPRQNKFDSHS
jgi:predicted  nucleic acid-binding Zn-ribbon protein